MLLIAVIDERVQPVDTFDEHIAATSAVAPIGTTEFDEFFATKGDATCTSIARADKDFSLIKKFHALSLQQFSRNGSANIRVCF